MEKTKRFKFNERGGLSYDPNGDMVLYDDIKEYLPEDVKQHLSHDERPEK